jgi:putative flippase GtrA
MLKTAPAPANIVSYTIALCGSFVLNTHFTFRLSAASLMPGVQFCRFVGVNLVALAGSTAAMWLLSAMIIPIAAKLMTTPFVTAWGFLPVASSCFAQRE